LKITAEKDQQSQYIVRIEIDPAELDEAKGKAAKRLSNKVPIKGFRPGKAPRALVERFIGQEALVEEATRDLMPKAYKEVLSQENIKPIADPEFKIDSIDPFVIIATIPVEPTVTLGNYRELKFDMPVVEENEEEIEKTIQQLRDQNSTWEEPEEERPAQDGDQVELEMQTLREGELVGEVVPRSGILGKGELLEQMDEQVVGMAVGEEKVIEIVRRKPQTEVAAAPEENSEVATEDASAEGETAAIAAAKANTETETEAETTTESRPALELPEVETLPLDPEEEEAQSDKPLVFKVKLNSIKVKHEPELDDDFATSVSDLTSFEELRERIRRNIKAQAEANAKRELVDKIVKEAVALSEVVMPPVMLNAEIHAMEESMDQRLKQQKLSLDQYLKLTGKDHEAFHEELRPDAENRIRTALVLRDIAQQEGITVDQGDLDREVEKMVDEYTLAAPEETREEQAVRLRQLFSRKETVDQMSNDIFSRKLGDRLIELATGVKPTAEDDASLDLELKADPNAATEASTAKLERTQGEIQTEAEPEPQAETEPEVTTVANPETSSVTEDAEETKK